MSDKVKRTAKKRGPGRPEVDSEQMTIRLPTPVIAAIDHARQKRLPIPTRQDVVRELIAEGLQKKGLLKG